jgi:energy-coupling factor transporter transmembrane protein EcfT
MGKFLPTDTRGWLTLGIFFLMVYVLTLVAFVPDLDKSQLFTALASGVIGSGFGAAVAYQFATSKGSGDAINKAMDIAKNSPVQIEPPATIKVEQ